MEAALRELLGEYRKSDGIVFEPDDVDRAIANAKSLLGGDCTALDCHRRNPRTILHRLVSELMGSTFQTNHLERRVTADVPKGTVRELGRGGAPSP